MTPYYSDDAVTLYHGDCLDVLRALPDASVDSVVTDPPYNLSFMAKPWDAYDGREDAGFAYWLTGLIDGEGHFAIKAHTRGTHAPYFQLKLRADERGIVERIKRSLGVGTVSIEERSDANPMVKYVIQDKAGCQRLVDLLDKYPLRAKKAVDYWMWREAVCEWTSRPRGNRWHGQTDNLRMAALRDRLMETRAYADVPWSGHEFQDWCRLWATECLRVLKPGGHMLAFGGTRTWHRLACAVEDAGFEIRDSIAWLYGSGWPKSLSVEKAIESQLTTGGSSSRALRATELGGAGDSYLMTGKNNGIMGETVTVERKVFAATQPQAQAWQGWGTALKPAFEPVVVARKPLIGTVAANVLEHGTGALNIDGCRVAINADADASQLRTMRRSQKAESNGWGMNQNGGDSPQVVNPAGRWPANLIHDGSEEVVGLFPVTTSNTRNPTGGKIYGRNSLNESATRDTTERGFSDSGSAARFFYCAKASKRDRDEGCEGIEERKSGMSNGAQTHGDGYDKGQDIGLNRVVARRNHHPTVKPTDLMRYLCRLVTPPGGTVLDPFMGSGSTGKAAVLEGFGFIGIEREAEYVEIAKARIENAKKKYPLGV